MVSGGAAEPPSLEQISKASRLCTSRSVQFSQRAADESSAVVVYFINRRAI